MNHWLSLGAPKSKLVVGIPTYGRSWTLSSSASNGLGAQGFSGGQPGPYTGASGFLGYNEICLYIKNNGWSVVKDPTKKMGPYAIKNNQWVGYDDPETAGIKAKYIMDNDLGGAMFWDLSTDDFDNNCGDGKYPIISTVNRVLADPNCAGSINLTHIHSKGFYYILFQIKVQQLSHQPNPQQQLQTVLLQHQSLPKLQNQPQHQQPLVNVLP